MRTVSGNKLPSLLWNMWGRDWQQPPYEHKTFSLEKMSRWLPWPSRKVGEPKDIVSCWAILGKANFWTSLKCTYRTWVTINCCLLVSMYPYYCNKHSSFTLLLQSVTTCWCSDLDPMAFKIGEATQCSSTVFWVCVFRGGRFMGWVGGERRRILWLGEPPEFSPSFLGDTEPLLSVFFSMISNDSTSMNSLCCI